MYGINLIPKGVKRDKRRYILILLVLLSVLCIIDYFLLTKYNLSKDLNASKRRFDSLNKEYTHLNKLKNDIENKSIDLNSIRNSVYEKPIDSKKLDNIYKLKGSVKINSLSYKYGEIDMNCESGSYEEINSFIKLLKSSKEFSRVMVTQISDYSMTQKFDVVLYTGE